MAHLKKYDWIFHDVFSYLPVTAKALLKRKISIENETQEAWPNLAKI